MSKFQRINKLICIFVFSFFILFVPRIAFSAPPTEAERVVLQLKWKHQFQFAGYYTAIAKGYYREVGLQVVLREGRPALNVADELVSGRANYGVAVSDILLERQKGKPIVALAVIFQHSPEALFVRKDSGVTTPHDLIGKNVMLRPNGNAEIRAMLMSEGIKTTQINIVPLTWDFKDFVSGKVVASAGYLTDRPAILKKLAIEYSILRPQTYGIDFYGDGLFATEKEINNHPARVKKFLSATIRGWEYAMEHPDEIVDLILKKYSVHKTREALLYEAKAMEELMQPKFIEIGHMNPGRWKHIADTFVKLGMLKPGYSLKGFLYKPKQQAGYAKIMGIVWAMLFVVIGITMIGIILLFFNHRLKGEVVKRTRELELERQFTEAILKTLPGLLYVYEKGERLIRWNKNFQQEAGFTNDEMAGRHPLDWFCDKEKEKIIKGLQQAFEAGEATVEANITFKKRQVPYYLTGTMLTIDDNTFLIGVGIDLTTRRQLEEQLRQAQKMESIGRLAGGIAHDFNNVLTTILGYCEILLVDMSRDDPHWEPIDNIHHAGEKAATLTRQLLAFSRKQILEEKVVSMNAIIKDFLKILGKMFGEDIIIQTYLEAKEGIIEADPGQMEQILMNLVVNARDAMLRGGNLIIETQDILVSKEYAESHMDVEPGPYVMFTVTDNGKGMTKEVMAHIFDPFFTTKAKHKGTGLGLATVYGIVKQHKGHIYVYSEINKGTTFKIYFPASQKTVEPDNNKNKMIPLSPGSETIMVVDDELSIRKLIVDALEPLGYKCLEASCGEDAIEISQSYTEDIHLLLTDVVMPGMSGRDLSAMICAERPDIKVIFMSGYTENVITHHGVLDANINYIPKPITPIALTKKIRSVLGG